MKYLIFIVLFSITLSGLSQTEKISYINKVKEYCPNADIVEMEIKTDYVEVSFWCDGKLTEIALNQNKEILYTEYEVNIPEDVLVKIKSKLDKKYNGWIIDEFSLIEMSDTTFYKVEAVMNGIEENIYFTTDGKYYKSKNIIINEPWNIENLKELSNYNNFQYNLLNPDKVFELPDQLREISGIALSDENTIFCIQDEFGIVFKYDIQKEEVTGIVRFTDIGDFEDISIMGDTAYILRSDATIFSFNYKNFKGKYNQTIIPVNCMNSEGICVNDGKIMYLSCKDQSINNSGTIRTLYSFPTDRMYKSEIFASIDIDEINELFSKLYPSIKKESITFNPSAVNINPVTKELYILSASNRMMAVYSNNKLKGLYPLPAEVYYKPEGLTFNKEGDMYISSEGIKNGFLGGEIYYFRNRNN